jgi:small GTP-binding protein
VQRFVKRWYLVNETQRKNISRPQDEQSSLQEEAQELRTLIVEPEFSHLRDNPLRLTMMATVFQHNGTLPHRQVDLYAEYLDLLLQTPSLGDQFNLSPDKKSRVLQVLAYQMMEHNLVEITEDEAVRAIYVPLDMVSRNPKGVEFLELIAKESGLLRQSRGGYRFEPLFFQEYLATLHLVERRRLSEMIKHVQSSWWHETIRLCGIHTASTEIIAASLQVIMSQQKNDGPLGHLPALRLAISCAQETYAEMKEDMWHQLQRILELQIDASDPVQRRLVGETLLDWRLKRMMRVNQDLYVAESLITNAEYRLFIEEQRISNQYPNHKFKKPFLADSGQKAVTGLQASDAVAFCEWLSKRDKLGFHYRLPYSGEFNPLVSKIGYWTQKEDKPAYELEEQARHELSLRGLESRLRSLIARDIANDPDAALARLSKFEYALKRAFGRKAHRTFTLGLARDFVHDRAHSRVHNDNQPTSHSEDSTWYAHFMAWLVTHKLLTLLREEPKPRSWLEQFDRHRIIIPPLEQKVLAEEYFELYNDLANLEEGSLGTLVTNHGIRIVGEHRLSASTSKKRKVLQKKICLVGDEGVGKTSLVRRFVEGRFDEKYLSTMGVSLSRKTVEQPAYTMNMVIWDMEGAAGFQKMQLNYLRGAAGALIVCDLTRRKTFAALERYARQLQTLNPTMPIVLIGNKIDVPLRQIAAQDLDSISATLGRPYLLTSAKTGTQVEETFCLLADMIEKQADS